MACCCIRDKLSSFIRLNKHSKGVSSTPLDKACFAAGLAAVKVLGLRVFDDFRPDKAMTEIRSNTTDANRRD
jgi:hypothetical protein